MNVNKNNKVDECFLDHDTEYTHILPPQQLKIDFSRNFNQQLPANQLRTARRPQNLAPRTFFLERPFYLLKDPLNRPCTEQVRQSEEEQGRLKLRIANRQNLPIELYFLKAKFRCVYNKLETYRSDFTSFQGRFKGVDSLIDYNWRCFKELEKEEKTTHVAADRIDSDFESGNLCRAYLSTEDESEYYLIVQSDVNTYGYNNWFFYRFRNKAKGVRRFAFVNLIKKTSFFNQGMMISVFSAKTHRYECRSWFKGGSKITFGSTNFTRNHHATDHYSSLSFEFDFAYDDDEVYFAINQPYTYSRLATFIKNAQTQPKKIVMQVKAVGYSISNNIIPAVRFVGNEDCKEIILIIARQHPCQTTGSFIAQKIMKSLIEQDRISQFLLKQYEFVVIPMANPDGVIHGVSRCNMAGLDLNRQWGDNVIKELAPQTIKIKQFIANLTKHKRIKYMIDLHGHAKKLNSFFFCCKNSERENMRLLSMAMKRLEPRFDVYGCTYGISRDKENTIRSKINSMGIVHSYTLETSLFGWKNDNAEIKHFNQEDYDSIAKNLMKSIFVLQAEPKLSLQQIGVSREELVIQMSRFIDKVSTEEEQDYHNNEILSESDPEGDKLDVKILLGNCENKALKKKIQEEYDSFKRPKPKRSKKLNREESIQKLSSKNMRQSCPSELDLKTKLSSTNHTNKNKDLLGVKSKANPFAEKWMERRKEIERKKAAGAKQLQEEERRNYTRIQARPRVKTAAELSRIKKPQMTCTSFKPKPNNFYHQKIKTQFKEIEELNIVSQEWIAESMNRKSALQIKFKQLIQQSSNVLLTDTLSILKISPNEAEKQTSPKGRQQRNRSVKPRKEHLLTEPVKSEPLSKITTLQNPHPEKETVRYRKFKQFLSNGGSSKKMQKRTNSVFYYFPIL